ncbi:MAG TPA: MBL fold metallo-hydrolase [Chthoniobacterales bacterium]|nr:MBL fold metallo-hydrolase [Chthoniobacterales bacterium]
MPPLKVTRFSGSLAGTLRHPAGELEFYWLGQSGFLFRTPSTSWLIDPYLSDHLAEKYRGHFFSHERMEPPPIAVHDLPELDYIFCTHSHGDHLDLPTLGLIGQVQPKTRFVLPGGIENELMHWPMDFTRFIWAEADKPLTLKSELKVIPVKAAHEEFECDQKGRHRFLGYLFQCQSATFYHSGDCVPYDGLAENLKELQPDVALLPVNGRRKELTEKRIMGNFSLTEAIELCLKAQVPAMIAQHFGLFAFNTIEPELIEQAARVVPKELQLLKAEVGTRYTLDSPTRA